MKKTIKILVIILIILVIFVASYKFVFDATEKISNTEGKNEELDSLKEDASSFEQELHDEIDKITGNGDEEDYDDSNDENINDKMEKLEDEAKEAGDKRDEKLGRDTLKESGSKYTGEPCKENCW